MADVLGVVLMVVSGGASPGGSCGLTKAAVDSTNSPPGRDGRGATIDDPPSPRDGPLGGDAWLTASCGGATHLDLALAAVEDRVLIPLSTRTQPKHDTTPPVRGDDQPTLCDVRGVRARDVRCDARQRRRCQVTVSLRRTNAERSQHKQPHRRHAPTQHQASATRQHATDRRRERHVVACVVRVRTLCVCVCVRCVG